MENAELPVQFAGEEPGEISPFWKAIWLAGWSALISVFSYAAGYTAAF